MIAAAEVLLALAAAIAGWSFVGGWQAVRIVKSDIELKAQS